MACNSPIYALDLGIKENGKRNLKILPRRMDLYSQKQLEARYGKNSIIPLPCGKCLACKLSKAREWAVRCVLEASEHDENCFITLTYSDEHLPGDHLLHREHIQNFLKRLRKVHQVRYFGCGEYGPNSELKPYGRPHYHLIIFGWFPGDWKNGSSKEIEKFWPYGFNTVDDCNFRTCNYVARYTTKKLYGSKTDDSFIMMSTDPGIGRTWIDKHFEVFNYDSVYGSFGTSKVSNIPRYFEKVFEQKDPEALALLKAQRIDKSSDLKLYEMLVHGFDEVEKMYEYKNDIQVHEFERKGKRKSL